jgi:hypothetical protein
LAQTQSEFPGDLHRWQGVATNSFYILEHTVAPIRPVEVRNSLIGEVILEENLGLAGSWYQFIDSGLDPQDFRLTRIHPQTVIEIVNGGTVTHKLVAGSWITP